MYRLLATLSLVFLIGTAAGATTSSLSGTVLDLAGNPVVGATVRVFECNSPTDHVVTGAFTDTTGKFDIRLNASIGDCFNVRVSSVGYVDTTAVVNIDNSLSPLRIKLAQTVAKIKGIVVTPKPKSPSIKHLDAEAVTQSALQSLIPTNPTAALKQPEISRVGSTHSSQLRVQGTNPVYYLNGLPIGTDPSHYGMFSVIPAPVVDQVTFHASGTDAAQRLPSTVEFSTPTPFGESFGCESIASTIDATTTFHKGGDRYYVLGALRKSVLDHLINHLNVSTDRRTLPPTNFQDVFASAGFRLNDHVRLMVDQYNVRDYLSYNSSGATNGLSSVSTSQRSENTYVGLRADALYGNWLIESQAAVQNGNEFYAAQPSTTENAEALNLNLSGHTGTLHANLKATADLGWSELTFGVQAERDLERSIDLTQHNWNFLPPFANTDNPYIYQGALNEAYGDMSVDIPGYTAAAFVSHKRAFHGIELTTGVRMDRYSLLAEMNVPSFRVRAGHGFEDGSYLELFAGSFSASPIDNILEPYQAIVRAGIGHLRPVETKLVAAYYRRGPVTATMFEKHIDNLATVTPDFSAVPYKSTEGARQFVTVASTGKAVFRGFSLAYDNDKLLDNRLDLQLSYGYTYAQRVDNNVTLDYELNAPHRLLAQANYRLTDRLTVGSELQVRSGYPYSPLRTADVTKIEPSRYTQDYYESTLSGENSLRFPANAYLNVSSTYTIGRSEIFLSVSNLTNRANPIINSGSGMIYDAGIMPMLGVRVKW